MSSRLLLVAYANAVLVIFLVIGVIYRLHFHPLAKLPGPLGNKISGWPHYFAAQSRRRHLWLLELHEKFGPVVRLTPNTVSINTATALKDIYGSRKASVKKGRFYQAVETAEGSATTFSVQDETLHGVKRRLLSHAFSERAIQDSEQYVSANIDKWLDQLGAGPISSAGWTESKNVGTWINYLTFDILTDLAYGRSFELLTKNDMRFATELIPTATQGTYIIGLHPLTRFMRWFLYRTLIGAWLAGPIVRDMQRLTEASTKFLAERRSLETSTSPSSTPARKDFFYHLFRGKDPESGRRYTNAELISESNLLLVAGSDTSATTLAASLFYLLRHPDVLSKLRQELESTFPNLSAITYTGTKLTTLPYLRAVLDETMRLNPPVGGTLPRLVLSPGITIDETFYPPGIEVGVPIHALHHNPHYFPSPSTFNPGRWLPSPKTGVTAESVELANSAFCAFSIGHRGCIGKNLAYMELSLALARCVWRFEMEEVSGWEGVVGGRGKGGGGWVSAAGEYVTKDGFVAQKEGPVVRFRERWGKEG